MNLIEYWNKHGYVATLKKMGHQRLAEKLLYYEKKKQQIIEKEGVMPFDNRPKKSQKILNQASKVILLADEVIFGN